MNKAVLGRTNQAFPKVWLGLLGSEAQGETEVAFQLGEAACSAACPLDVMSNPGLWGQVLRGQDAVLVTGGGLEIESAPDSKTAKHLIQAHLIELLASLGRDHLDFYFLWLRKALEEAQMEGALEALALAKLEGEVRFIGLYAAGPGMAILGTWQFHDAFDVVMTPLNPLENDAYRTLCPLARERRVGLVTCRPLNWGYGASFSVLADSKEEKRLAQSVIAARAKEHPVLVGVRTRQEALFAMDSIENSAPADLAGQLEPYQQAYQEPSSWVPLLDDSRPWVRAAASKALRSK